MVAIGTKWSSGQTLVRFEESTGFSDSLKAEHERKSDEQIKADSEGFGLNNWKMEQGGNPIQGPLHFLTLQC